MQLFYAPSAGAVRDAAAALLRTFVNEGIPVSICRDAYGGVQVTGQARPPVLFVPEHRAPHRALLN